MRNIFFKVFGDPYEQYQPIQKLPKITFQKKVKRQSGSKIDDADLPKDVEKVQGDKAMRHEKKKEIEHGIEVEMWSKKDATLQIAEWKAIEKKYPSINKDAVIAMKREWAKESNVSIIERELRKRQLGYGQTYIKFCTSVFNEYDKKVGESHKETPTPLSV